MCDIINWFECYDNDINDIEYKCKECRVSEHKKDCDCKSQTCDENDKFEFWIYNSHICSFW